MFMFNLIKKYFGLGLYNESDLNDFVEVGTITLSQKEEILK